MSLRVEPLTEEQIGMVQGILPDSKNEWYVALALEKLGIEFRFQVPIGGGWTRGGQIVDFVAYSPEAKPVFVQGSYWHDDRKETEDLIKQAAARAIFGTDPILLEEHETDTADNALKAVRDKVL